jgi:hypothetical protein
MDGGGARVAVVVRELRGAEETDEAAKVCKRAFNQVQVPALGRMVSFHDEGLSCRAFRTFASWVLSLSLPSSHPCDT